MSVSPSQARAVEGREALWNAVRSTQWSQLGAPGHWKRLAGERLVVYTLSGSHESDIRNSPEAAARLLGQCLDESTRTRNEAKLRSTG